jgi:predicted P-loop ATPase/GTPase
MSRIVKTFICAKSEAVVINGEVVVSVIDILDRDVVLAVTPWKPALLASNGGL